MAGRRKGAFTFDLSHPIRKGVLLKQGAFHKAFKYRFFLVYPGFLVYYEQESKWLLDLTKGDTLGGRLGAIKLKGGSCNVARDAPKACKFGFIVHAPDPVNKRPTYLINATSKQDRDEWIEAIRKSTPQSPQQQRKNDGSPRIREEPRQKEPESIPPHPSSPVRQDTAAVAATVATENERLNGVDQSITSIDEDRQPTLDVRRDTAAAAALSLTSRNQGKEKNSATENHQDTSIDDILGPRINEDKDSDISDESSQRTTSPTDSSSIPAQSPDPESTSVNSEAGREAAETEVVKEAQNLESESKVDSSPMELSETVENQMNSHGNVEVVTSVTVECTGNGEATIETTIETGCDGNGCTIDKEDSTTKGDVDSNPEAERQQEVALDENQAKSDESASLGEQKDSLGSSSSEVLITQERPNSFSVNVTNIDTDDYSSSDEDETQPPPFVESSEANGTPPSQEVTSSEEAPKVNGECPTITVEAVEAEKKHDEVEEVTDKRSDSESSSTEGDKLTPTPEGRRSSQPFIEKKGFLYKMGGKRKSWNLRYFVLRPGVFTYSKNPHSKLLGEVKLKNLQVFFPGAGERKTSFQFTIHTESTWNKRMDWVLAAQSEREMKDWIQAFRLAGQKNMPSPATSDNEQDST